MPCSGPLHHCLSQQSAPGSQFPAPWRWRQSRRAADHTLVNLLQHNRDGGASLAPLALPTRQLCRHLQHQSSRGRFKVAASRGEKSRWPRLSINIPFTLGILLVLTFGVANRVLYRMALVPMKNYVFFLAQAQNLAYIITYFSILYFRIRMGLVTDRMLRIDKTPMVWIGACDAVGQLLFMIGASQLPGILLPIINQSYVVWNLTFASIVLHVRYTKLELLGALLVVIGVAVAAMPPQVFGLQVVGTALDAPPKYILICIITFAFPAMANVIKEGLFRRTKAQLGRNLDIFVVNSYGALSQALFATLLLPITMHYYRISLAQLPTYLLRGFHCFMGQPVMCGEQCTGAPLLPLAYVAANIACNISLLMSLQRVGTVTTTIVASCFVPLTIAAFTMPLPYLEKTVLGPNFIAGAVVLVLGMVVYNISAWHHMTQVKCQPLKSLEEQEQEFEELASTQSRDLPWP